MKLPVMIIQVERKKTSMREKLNFTRLAMILLGGSFFFANPAFSQSVGCTQNLTDAQAQFDIGNLPGIPKMLEECIRSRSFSPEQNVQAHKLITLVHLYQDDQENADIWMSRLLVVDPEHKLDPTVDPAEIIFLKEKFLYKPIFRVSVFGTGNRTSYNQLTGYTMDGMSELLQNPKTATPGIGFGGGALVEKEVMNLFDVGLGLSFFTRTFNTTTDLLYPGNTLVQDEQQAWLELPVFLKYTYYGDGNMNWNPYVIAGGSVGYLLSASLQNSVRANDDANVTGRTINSIDLDQRKQINYFANVGLGVKKRAKTHFFFIEIRYSQGLTNVAKGANRYAGGLDTLYYLGHVDSNYSLNGLVGVIGYQRSIYNPRKIKN